MIHIFLLQSKNSYQHKNVYFKVAYLTSGLLMLAQHNHLVLLLLLLDHFVLLARLLQDRLLMHIHLSRLLFERAHQLLLVDQTQLPLYALLVESLHLFGAIAVLSVPVPEQRLLQLGAEAAALEALKHLTSLKNMSGLLLAGWLPPALLVECGWALRAVSLSRVSMHEASLVAAAIRHVMISLIMGGKDSAKYCASSSLLPFIVSLMARSFNF